MGGTMGTLIGVVVVVVVVILGIIVQAVMAKRARAQQAARLQAGNDAPNTPNTVTNPHAHGNPNPDPMSITTNTNASTDRTIFMVVVVKGHVDPEAVAKTIVRALQRARAPSRVFVGVYDATGGGFTPGFQRVCGRDGYPADVLTTGRVRVLAPPKAGHQGGFCGREQVLRYLYGTQTYIFMLGEAHPLDLAHGWDDTCIHTLEATPAPASTVLTAPFTSSREERGVFAALRDPPSSMLVPVPRVVGVPCTKVSVDPSLCRVWTPAVAWSPAMSFHRGPDIGPFPSVHLLASGPGGALDPMEPFLMTLQWRAAGWSLVHPLAPIVWPEHGLPTLALGPLAAPAHANAAAALRATVLAGLPNKGATCRAIGVSPGTLLPDLRSAAGITATADETEVVAKLGSLDVFYGILAGVEVGVDVSNGATLPSQ